jgi:amino acid adenylation domain-containing protein
MTPPDQLEQRLAALSPEKRELVRRRMQQASQAAAGAPITRVPRDQRLPLSSAQSRLWFLSQLEGPSATYNVAAAVRLSGSIDRQRLESALQVIVRRHEVLRTNFVRSVSGEPDQRIAEPSSAPAFRLAIETVRGSDLTATERAMHSRAEAEARRPFDLASDPLLRVTLLEHATLDPILLLVAHHIVIDGWSMGLLLRELSELYRAHERLPDLPIQYADYAAWETTSLSAAALDRSVEWWRASLDGAPAALAIPTDRPRPPVLTHRGGAIRFAIDADVMRGLRTIAEQDRVSVFAATLAITGVVLGRHAAQDDVVIGCPFANRPTADTQKLIGFFVNTLPMRVRWDAAESFRALVLRTHALITAAIEHQAAPLDRLVDALGTERDPSRTPIYQAVLAYQAADQIALDFDGVDITPLPIDTAAAKFDLALILDDSHDGCDASLQYNVDLYDEQTAQRIAAHFVELLRSVADNPDAPLGELAMMAKAERDQLIDDWSGLVTEYPRDATVTELFAEIASAQPGDIALVHGDEALTYEELDRRSSRVAAALQQRGVVSGAKVPICAHRSIEMFVATIAILKAGAIYVPIDPSTPASRLALLLRDTQATLILTHDVELPSVPVSLAVLPIGEAERCNEPLQRVEINALDGAYVMFTSGSTGAPKGVLVPHRAIVRLVRGTNFMSMGRDETFLQLAATSFDAATLEVWAPLLNGGRLAIGPAEAPTLANIGELIARHEVTSLWLTASLFNLMVDERLDALAGVRQLLTGGDVLSVPHVLRAARALPNSRIINGYGPTENTTFTCCFTVDPQREYPRGIPIGTPIANTRVYILDTAGQLCPIGVPGELHAGGDGLALGYINHDELNRERFIANPFGEGKLYRTGDAARWLPDGNIEFHGRLDQQVKIRGYRVEPREIEAALQRVPGLSDAAVIARNAAAGTELIAYVVPNDGSTGAYHADRVRDSLRAELPDFMVPAAIVVIASLPLTRHGKLDRAALPAPERQLDPAAWIAPATDTEIELAAIFAELLGVKQVGSTDSFFALGGHSLSATQLVSRINSRIGIELPLRQVFETPQVSRLAAVIDGGRASTITNAIPPVDRGALLPLSFAQRRLWFLNRLEPDNPFYNIAIALRLDGSVDSAALDAALNDIVDRHEILRSTYHEHNGEPSQRIHPGASIALTHVFIEPQDLDRLAREEARRPFDLEAGPIIRATLAQLSADRHALLITIHHIAADGWSMGVLVNELTAAYAARAEGRRAGFAPLPIQYADFAAWQQNWISGPDSASDTDYWMHQLAGYPAELTLPGDRPRPAVQSFSGGSIRFEIDPQTSDRLSALARENDATLFMVLLAAFAALLARQSNQHDLVIGSPVASRSRAELEPLVGFFVNTLALRVDASGDPAFRTLLSRVRETALGGYAHQNLPFDRLVDELQPARDLSRNPLFQVMFALQNAPVSAIALPGITVTPIDIERSTAQFDIVLDMWPQHDGLLGVLEFSTALFDHSTVARMIDQYRTILTGIVADPDATLSRLPMLGDSERRTLLDGFNSRRAQFPVNSTLHELFEEQVALDGTRIAVADGARELSYAQLNAGANRIAHRLRALGVGRNDFVGVLLERSIDFLAAMLGVLKAGAAYVPIDPTYPADRIEYMITHSRARVLIARRAFLTTAITATIGDVTCLFPEEDSCAAESPDNPASINASSDRAYMLYTSGSTGLPKGAILRHDGKINHIYAQFEALQFHRDSVFLQTAPASSDISVWQFIGPLLIGGRTVIVDYETMCDPAELWRVIRDSRASIIELVPVAMASLLEHVSRQALNQRATTLEVAMVTGEAVSPAIVNRWLELFPKVPIVNAYGPTEAADDVCQAMFTRPLPVDARTVSIGKPLANLSMYVLDERLQLAPIGVPGEICVSGIGVGEGYWQDPERTRASFVANPFDEGKRDAVLYRTGDVGVWRPDGTLECLSRTDHQIKIRGFRIEAGEIEAVLASHAAVRDVVVVARDDGRGDKRLAAYVTPQLSSAEVAGELRRIRDEQVELWTDLHQDEYQQTLDYGDPTFNVIGWDSTYTAEPLPRAEMREYVDATVDRIRSLNPRRLLEIGSGSGLIMFGLLPHLESYYGLDLSEVAIDRLKRLQESPELRARVTNFDRAVLRAGRADDLSWIEPGTIDTVIFPSVLQYFPGIDYLRAVVDEVVRVIAPGGSIVFSDVRHLSLLDAFHASVTLFKSPDETTVTEITQRWRERSLQEQEMAIDPAFFESLRSRYARPLAIDVMPKRGVLNNEMTRFRYDVVVRLDQSPEDVLDIEWIDWRRARPGLDRIEQMLADGREPIAFTNIRNARLSAENALLARISGALPTATAASLRGWLETQPSAGIDPEQLQQRAGRAGHLAHLSMARGSADGSYDAIIVRKDSPAAARRPAFPAAATDPAAQLANDPLHERLARFLMPQLRDYVKTRVPHYMVPSDLVILERMPTTPAGKIDRRALPAPPLPSVRDLAFRPPQTSTERVIAAIWQEVLDLEQCGLGQNFFEIGGHSLKATQVTSRIRQRLGVDLPLRAVFANPTIEELAVVAGESSRANQEYIPKIADASDYPVSPAQRRLWILAQLEDGSIAYNMPASVLIDGALDIDRLDEAFAATVARHESLRTTFHVVNGEPRQRVDSGRSSRLDRRDFSSLVDPEDAARRAATTDAGLPFDLERGPLVRASLIKIAAERHALLFNVHHIVSDDWSMGVLVREVMQRYCGADQATLRLQYRDFASWHHAQLADRSTHRDYWVERLSGDLPVLDLPADRPRPALKTYRGRAITRVLAADRAAQLREIARGSGATLFMTLIASAKTLLHRYTGASDIIVAVPASGREHAELEQQIGFYINTLALRDRVLPEQSFRELLSEVTRHTTEAIEHQSYPFDRLVDELPLRRDPSRMPICDVAVVMASAGAPQLALPGLDIRTFVEDFETSKYDLHFVFDETTSGAVTTSLVYNPDLFDADRIERMLQHLHVLIESIIEDPNEAIGTLALLPAAEEEQLLVKFNPVSTKQVEPQTLTGWFARSVRQHTDRIAVSGLDGSVIAELTYAELDQRSSTLAGELRQKGIGRGMFVGLFVERRVEALIGILGILKAGAAYVPIDPAYPEERIRFILQDAAIRVVVSAVSPEWFATAGIQSVMLDQHFTATAIAPDPAADPADVAYMIYTSGSTGQPKGVMVTHANVTRLFSSTEHWFGFSSSDVWSVFHSLAFDFSVWELWGALLYGGRAVMVPHDVARSPEALVALLEREGVTMLNQTPSAFRALIDSQQRNGWAMRPQLRYVIFGGEALHPQMLQPWVDRFGDNTPQLINMYGITETTVHVTYRRITIDDIGARSVIGAPIPDLQVYLLDQRLQPVPIGVAGEICVAGDGVARGYWRRDQLTESRFVANPFGDGRLYRSGDLGRYLANGDIEYLGRLDHQVKVRGFRIELGEIEAALGSHAGVRQSLAIADRKGAEVRLIAYVATNEDAATLRRHLQSRLPDYMVPSVIVPVDQFPLTAHGKIDRSALPSPDSRLAHEDEDVTTWTAKESVIAQTFARELGVASCGRRINFFDLGAHSLMLIRVHAALQSQLGRQFPLAALYRHPSIEQLAAFLDRGADSTAEASASDAQDRAAKRRQLRRRAPERGNG